MPEVLLVDTLYINKNTHVTLAWDSEKKVLGLATWRPILTGDLAGNFEKIGSVILTGRDVEKFIASVVEQETGQVRQAAHGQDNPYPNAVHMKP